MGNVAAFYEKHFTQDISNFARSEMCLFLVENDLLQVPFRLLEIDVLITLLRNEFSI